MKEIILIKDGEIVLKGLNRRQFEDVLKKNIRIALHELGKFEITSAQSTITVKPLSEDIDLDRAEAAKAHAEQMLHEEKLSTEMRIRTEAKLYRALVRIGSAKH